ncbi:MAG: hypothetical protein RL154_709 [Pseudomonadota bacterium]|jgi:toxin ParE1/3/4
MRDLENIIEYIKLDSVQNAKNVFNLVKAKTKSLNAFANRGRIMPWLLDIGVAAYRELICERWRLIYKISDANVFIMMIIDSKQNADDILFKRLIK